MNIKILISYLVKWLVDLGILEILSTSQTEMETLQSDHVLGSLAQGNYM